MNYVIRIPANETLERDIAEQRCTGRRSTGRDRGIYLLEPVAKMEFPGNPVSATKPGHRDRGQGLTLRQAALIVGIFALTMVWTAPFAEFFVFPKLVIRGNVEQTVQNIVAHRGLYLTGIFCYLANFISDVVIAWALYVLLVPVNRAVSLLAAIFRLVYTAVAVVALLKLATVFRLLNTPDYLAVFGPQQLHAQVKLLLDSWRYEWSMSLVLFDVHLGLVGYLVYRSGYIPRILGVLLVIDGLGWLIDNLQPYLYPNAHLGFLFITWFGELIFMFWLLFRGWKIQEPVQQT
ncbi:MAG: DUF4386 domain-containing protein [Acidobacteria bacterium]|nr:DUF4386 domain-containing protein [Acidobacteriota bacterium]